MLVDPAIWAAFHQARDALITALHDALLVKRVHAITRAGAVAPSSTSTLIQAISEAKRELKTARHDLSNIQSHLVRTRAVVVNWSSPFAMLPHELVRDIVSHTIQYPYQRRQILRLSHVSQRLRETVVDMSWLFTDTDWNHWQYPLVELWCRRAGSQLLTISLDDFGLRRCGRAPEFRALLDSCSPRWGELGIRLNGFTVDNQDATGIVQSLLKGSAPSLQALVLTSKRFDPTVNFELDCGSSLRMVLGGIWPLFSASSVSVTSLTFHTGSSRQLSRLGDVLNSCPLLRRLTLDIEYYSILSADGMDIDHSTKTSLPSLVYLGLRGVAAGHIEAIRQLFGCLDMPSLKYMAVSPCHHIEGDIDLLWTLVRSQFYALDTWF
jgi:hypothetical protein